VRERERERGTVQGTTSRRAEAREAKRDRLAQTVELAQVQLLQPTPHHATHFSSISYIFKKNYFLCPRDKELKFKKNVARGKILHFNPK
jgi:hypothetical protein